MQQAATTYLLSTLETLAPATATVVFPVAVDVNEELVKMVL